MLGPTVAPAWFADVIFQMKAIVGQQLSLRNTGTMRCSLTLEWHCCCARVLVSNGQGLIYCHLYHPLLLLLPLLWAPDEGQHQLWRASLQNFPCPEVAWFNSRAVTAGKQLLDRRLNTLTSVISVSWFIGMEFTVSCTVSVWPCRWLQNAVLLPFCDCFAEHYQDGGGWLQSPSLKKLPKGWSPMFSPIDFFNALHIRRQDSTDETE